MATVQFEAQSTKDFPQFQEDLNRAIYGSFAAHVMRLAWSGFVLNIEAPGSVGFVRFDAGRITAEIKMSFPATLMREQIIQDIRRTIEAGCGSLVKIL